MIDLHLHLDGSLAPQLVKRLAHRQGISLHAGEEDGLKLDFHGGVKGKRIGALRADRGVCLEVGCEEGLTGEGELACRYSYAFSSIVGYGKVEFAKDNDEKRQGFDVIMQHQTGRGGWTYTDAALSVAEVFWVRADSFEASQKLAK